MMKGMSFAIALFGLIAVPFAVLGQTEGQLRLVGGSAPNEGRVEVFHAGQWGTVCDDFWGQEDADVVCRQLGFGPALSFPCCAAFGQGSDPIWMDNVTCNGTESRLVDCPFNGFGINDCSHFEDASVTCGPALSAAPAVSGIGLLLLASGLAGAGLATLRKRRASGR
jgi:hypothetical protein